MAETVRDRLIRQLESITSRQAKSTNDIRNRLNDGDDATAGSLNDLRNAQSQRVSSPQAGLDLLSRFVETSPGAAFGAGVLANDVDFANFVNKGIDDARENLDATFRQRQLDLTELNLDASLTKAAFDAELSPINTGLQIAEADTQRGFQAEQSRIREQGANARNAASIGAANARSSAQIAAQTARDASQLSASRENALIQASLQALRSSPLEKSREQGVIDAGFAEQFDKILSSRNEQLEEISKDDGFLGTGLFSDKPERVQEQVQGLLADFTAVKSAFAQGATGDVLIGAAERLRDNRQKILSFLSDDSLFSEDVALQERQKIIDAQTSLDTFLNTLLGEAQSQQAQSGGGGVQGNSLEIQLQKIRSIFGQ